MAYFPTPLVTPEMYARGQFFTKKSVAQKLINTIDVKKYGLVIDPSVGSGAFFDLIIHPNKIGIDIDTRSHTHTSAQALSTTRAIEHAHIGDITHSHPRAQEPRIIEADFLKFKPVTIPPVLTIGGPPWEANTKGILALKFIRRAAMYSDTIAFILPIGFKQRSAYDSIPLNFWKVNEIDLPPNSFTIGGNPADVPAVWMEFEKRRVLREKSKGVTRSRNVRQTRQAQPREIVRRRRPARQTQRARRTRPMRRR